MERKEVWGLVRLGFAIGLMAGASALLMGRLDQVLHRFVPPVLMVGVVLVVIGLALMTIRTWLDSR